MLASTLEKHQLAGFRQLLGVRAVELKRKIAAAHNGGSSTTGREVHDTKDQASMESIEEIRRTDLDRDRTELADVELALARIDVGTYGICCDCERPIGRKRLQAYPTAKRCHACQQAYEQRSARVTHN